MGLLAAKKNKYKLKSNGLEITQSLLAKWCFGKSDKDVIRQILIVHRFFGVLESFDNGEREMELVKIREHQLTWEDTL